jgi:hypothetical protein
VDKQTRTTSATKKYVDNPYLIWFARGKVVVFLWKTRIGFTGSAEFRRAEEGRERKPFDCAGSGGRLSPGPVFQCFFVCRWAMIAFAVRAGKG